MARSCRQHVEAAHAGHLDVEQHEVERAPARAAVSAVDAVGGHGRLEAVLAQPPRQRVAVGFVVVDDEEEARGFMGTSSGSKQALDLLEQLLEAHRFGIKILGAGGERLLAVVDHRVGAQHDDRNRSAWPRRCFSWRVASQPSMIGKPRSIRIRSGVCARARSHALLAVHGRHHA